jgi:hypothetical protein
MRHEGRVTSLSWTPSEAGEQPGRDEGLGAGLPGQRERFPGERDGRGRVVTEQAIRRGVGELDGGVGQFAAGPREIGGLFGEAGGVGERTGSDRDI